MNESSMNSDPKSVNDRHKNNQDHNPPPKDLKMKQKVIEDHNYQPAKDSKMKQKIDDDDDVYQDLFPLYPRYFEEQFNIENIGNFVQVGFEERRDQRDDDYRGESSKRKRITKSPELIDLNSDSSSSEPVKLIEEIVKTYSDYIEHVFQMMKDRFNDEQRWNFDKTKCSDLAEIFVQKMRRLGIELNEMKKDPNQRENYRVIEPRVLQITNQLEKMHERFDSSQNIRASAKRKCTRYELILCINEIDEMMKELYGITLRIEELKTLDMKNKTMEIRQRNFRI